MSRGWGAEMAAPVHSPFPACPPEEKSFGGLAGVAGLEPAGPRLLLRTALPEGTFLPFQQLELITPFQLYFNPELIFKHFQVWGCHLRTPCSGR